MPLIDELVSVVPSSWRVTDAAGLHLGTVTLCEWRPGDQWLAAWTPTGQKMAVTSYHATQGEAVAAIIAGRAG